ncbi:MAG: HIT domain-containing protein [archaeon]
MEDCIFCKIVKGEIESIKIWEDQNFLAILDVHPNTEGMTLILTKEHYDSYVFKMPEDIYSKFMFVAKKVSRILEKGLGVNRVAIVMEGMGINHAHLKLYPLHGVKQEFQEMWAEKEVYFDEYKGYISTQLGPKKSMEELKKTAEKIRGEL